MLKLLVPILIILLIVAGALVFWKLGMSGGVPSFQQSTNPTTSSVSKQAPITGNPDDINNTINQAAQAEATVATSNDESTVVNQNNPNTAAVGDSINENSF